MSVCSAIYLIVTESDGLWVSYFSGMLIQRLFMFCNCNPNAVIKCFYHVVLAVVLEPCVPPMTVSCRNSITAGHTWYQHSLKEIILMP
jgi:hypothetical protein